MTLSLNEGELSSELQGNAASIGVLTLSVKDELSLKLHGNTAPIFTRVAMIHKCNDESQYFPTDTILDIFYNCNTLYANIFSKV